MTPSVSVLEAVADDFLTKRGIDPAVWEARGCWHYERDEAERVKDEFRDHLPASRLRTVTTIVKQSPGQLMPKHPPLPKQPDAPAYPPIPPQMRPDAKGGVYVNRRPVVHIHLAPHYRDEDGKRHWTPREDLPVYPEGHSREGQPLPRRRKDKKTGKWEDTDCYIYGGTEEIHVNAGKPFDPETGEGDHPYDPETGEGAHFGENIDYVHMHVAQPCRYIMLGRREEEGAVRRENARIDIHPWAFERLEEAEIVFMALEGTPKTDSILSAILRNDYNMSVFGVPSVTCWDAKELRRFAYEYLRGKRVLIVPDADWATNWQVEWQALKARKVLERTGVAAHVCAPPTKDRCQRADQPYYKGVDDFLGARNDRGELLHDLGELWIEGREVPGHRIEYDVRHRHDLHPNAMPSAVYALEDLSLHVNRPDSDRPGEEGTWSGSISALKSMFGIRDPRAAVDKLRRIEWAFTVISGSLDDGKKRIPWVGKEINVWKQTPTISLKEQYRARVDREELLAEDFWKRAAHRERDRERRELDKRFATLEASNAHLADRLNHLEQHAA